MKYRAFGRLDWRSSVLGMGVMRLPGLAGESARGVLDEAEAIRMIRHGIDSGINYVDLGFPWNMARHEPIVRTVGKALADGYRSKVKVALTVPALLVSSAADFDRCLDTQLQWLAADGVDFCLLGRLTRDNWPALQQSGVLDRLETAQSEGRVDHAGFSFHDHYQVLKSIVEAYDRWVVCSVQYSYMDVDHNPGATGIRWAAEQGLAVVATEPFKGGRLTREPPAEIPALWERSGRERSPAEWALRFVWNHPGISVAVADMSSAQQLEEDLKVADLAEANSLSIAEEVAVSNVRDALRKRRPVPCPSCRPCMPCPVGIDVPRFFEIYNDAVMYDDVETARTLFRDERIYPADCTECGLCEGRCAKRLPMIDLIAEGRSFLGLG
jgi:predicted aldo/keto reductase-like oxidoreductase